MISQEAMRRFCVGRRNSDPQPLVAVSEKCPSRYLSMDASEEDAHFDG